MYRCQRYCWQCFVVCCSLRLDSLRAESDHMSGGITPIGYMAAKINRVSQINNIADRLSRKLEGRKSCLQLFVSKLAFLTKYYTHATNSNFLLCCTRVCAPVNPLLHGCRGLSRTGSAEMSRKFPGPSQLQTPAAWTEEVRCLSRFFFFFPVESVRLFFVFVNLSTVGS